MAKYVSDTKAAKSLSAHVILRPDGSVVGVVKIHHGQGRKFCNIHQRSDAWRACAVAFGMDLSTRVGEEAGHNRFGFQYATASGYGMDLTNQMLSGLMIDGHKLTDDCGESLPRPAGGLFPQGFTPPPGYSLCNWSREGNGWMDCYRSAGLRYLTDLGYEIITAI